MDRAFQRRPVVIHISLNSQLLNRAVARLPLFEKIEDYEAFERVLNESFDHHPLPIYAYVVMPNHWHFVPS